jgi:hypothetical protein
MSDTLAGYLPLPFDLQWTEGDTVEFTFLFQNVNWMETDPDPDALLVGEPEWIAKTWQAQVRHSYQQASMQYNQWVPAYGYQHSWWRGYSGVVTFGTAADLYNSIALGVPQLTHVYDPVNRTMTGLAIGEILPAGYYTRVRLLLTGDLSPFVLPGYYYWDLQSMTPDVPTVRTTYLSGRVRVHPQWTML